MKSLHGIGVSPGFAVGKAFIFHREDYFAVSHRQVSEADLPKEIARFEDALTSTRAEILGIRKKISAQIGREHSDIFNAHLLILEDRTLIENVIAVIKEESTTAEYAFVSILKRYFQAFSAINDEYLKERVADLKDIGRRLLQNLCAKEKKGLENLNEKVVLIAHDLAPSDTAMIDKEKVLAFVTEIGGPTSHTAILGRSLEIPAVVGLDGVTAEVQNGDTVVVDGTRGLLIVEPDAKVLEDYTREELRFTQFITELDKLRNLPAETLDGRHIRLVANIEFNHEVPSVISHGAEGVGLYRTEYIYMNRKGLPSEEEQFFSYKQVVEKMHPAPVTIRTLDLGGDKFISALEIPHEMNPFLGWRAIRFCLTRVDIFKVQLRAILRASIYGNLKVMYPMISSLDELVEANRILEECRQELKEKGIDSDPNMEVGAMIEIPSAAIMSNALAREADFFSIGTNDLIQYSLAVDRVNEKIAYLYEPMHPAILRLIKQVIDNGHERRITVACCGEMAGDPAIAVILTGLEIDELSTSPLALPKVKKAVRSVTFKDAKILAQQALEFNTGIEIKNFIQAKLKPVLGELIED